jgi:putative transposase
MPNHYHLMLDTPRADLPEGMRELNGAYATRFNTAHELSGHVFQGRYGSRLIRSDAHAREVSRYIPLNPVRAGLRAQPADWPWSSYRAAVGMTRPPAWLTIDRILGWFGEGEAGRRAYREFVAAGKDVTDPEGAALREVLAHARAQDIRRVHDEHGYSIRAIARALGLHHSTVAQRLAGDPPNGV